MKALINPIPSHADLIWPDGPFNYTLWKRAFPVFFTESYLHESEKIKFFLSGLNFFMYALLYGFFCLHICATMGDSLVQSALICLLNSVDCIFQTREEGWSLPPPALMQWYHAVMHASFSGLENTQRGSRAAVQYVRMYAIHGGSIGAAVYHIVKYTWRQYKVTKRVNINLAIAIQ